MSGPDFRELIGDEGSTEELEQLRRAHDMLVAAGPPPELSPAMAEAPGAPGGRSAFLPRRRKEAAFVLAAAVAAGDFAGFFATLRCALVLIAEVASRQTASESEMMCRMTIAAPLSRHHCPSWSRR
ncbi:MAG: hypothetical protein QOF61_3014 [Acidobacteriota bacterium]|nr:hypothetical protein [Acidobacteriota bacterium]